MGKEIEEANHLSTYCITPWRQRCGIRLKRNTPLFLQAVEFILVKFNMRRAVSKVHSFNMNNLIIYYTNLLTLSPD